MHAKINRPFVVLVAVLGQACTAPSPTSSASAFAPAAPVNVASVVAVTEAVPRLIALTGTLKASAESSVAANANGQISRTFVERGSVVAKGAPLVTLDRRWLRSHALSASSFCERMPSRLARASAAESRQRQATVSLTDATVRAPFAGVVLERFVNVGEYVTANTKIVELVQNNPVRLELVAGELDAAAVHVGQTVTFEVKAMPGTSFLATVRYVAPALREATRDLVFEAVAPNGDGRLKPGMFATAWLEAGSEAMVVVPQTALRKREETVHVFVIKNGHLEERVVHVERDLGSRAAVKTGLAAGERVVCDASKQLKDGLAVVD
jgi:membrane fusion protein (multidrug efflux system)